MQGPVWINGSAEGRLDPSDRGLAYGDGVFETVRVAGGRVVLRERHLARLAAGAAALGLVLDSGALAAELDRFLAVCAHDGVVKIIVTRGSGGRGYLPDPAASPTRVLSSHPLPAWPAAHAQQGIEAVVCSLGLSIQPRLAGLKHLNRLEQVLLRQELEERGGTEGVVCDARGRVVEGVFSNLFLVRSGALATPRLDEAGVRGVLRDAIIAEARTQGLPVSEGHYGLEEMLAADEVFFCNSVYGIWPVRALLGRTWAPGPVTRRWQAFWQQVAGEG